MMFGIHRLLVDPSVFRLSFCNIYIMRGAWSSPLMQRAWSLVIPPHYSAPVGSLKQATSDRNGSDGTLPPIRYRFSRPCRPWVSGLFFFTLYYEEAYSSICSRKMFAFISHESSSSRSPHGFDPYQRLMDDAFDDFGGSVRPVAIVDYLIVSDRKAVV